LIEFNDVDGDGVFTPEVDHLLQSTDIFNGNGTWSTMTFEKVNNPVVFAVRVLVC
jgi:hypothetical protein